MSPSLVPIKTPAGHDELAHRTRRLGQRHRTVLLLVDGRRSVVQVLQMAEAAGVPPACFDELVALGLLAAADGEPLGSHVDLPLGPEDSVLPASRSLLPESGHGDLAPLPQDDLPPPGDPQLEEARDMLMRAIRNEAPVAGSLTLMKLRRAASREELEELLDEVLQRISKPRKQIVAAQLMRHVRHLLSLPPMAG